MASTSFSLTGRQHPSVAENVVNSTKAVEPEPVLAVEPEPVLAVEQIVEPVLAVEPEPVLDAWNANWSRAKLFEAATLLNIKVSATSSKNDIIAALKAATV